MPRGQAERLMSLLNELLEEASLDWSDIGKIGVCTGPGNFTGIRIAVSAARGLALGLEIPAVVPPPPCFSNAAPRHHPKYLHAHRARPHPDLETPS